MKRKIFVVDEFTNGHEAAKRFTKKLGWKKNDVEIIFCGDHQKVIKRLSENQGFAVLPIKNSIVGDILETQNAISSIQKMGFDFKEISKISLKIRHCLLAKKGIKIKNLKKVLSHEKALEQCDKFLASINILGEKRVKFSSTGGAAKFISKTNKSEALGAIAPKIAAKAYNLKVIKENIGDLKNNETTFILLENKAVIEKVKVGIIGINGNFGKLLKNFFESIGAEVSGSGSKTEITNKDIAKNSDVVIFSVPINKTVNVINSVISYTRKDQLVIDVTSIKRKPIEAMMHGKAQVLGLHPMFRPDVGFGGQTIVACPQRLTNLKWKKWVVNMLSATGSKIKWSTPEEHDFYMSAVQVVPHIANLVSALLLKNSKVSISKSLEFTSPFYRVMFSLIGRLLSQGPSLYSSIILENSETSKMFEKRIKIEKDLLKIIKKKDYSALENKFIEAKNYFGEKATKEADDLFKRLISILTTLYGKNSIILEFSKIRSRPGLLERVTKVFGNRKINLSGINSVNLGDKVQFAISFDKSKSSEEIKRALEEIESWSDHTVKIIY